MAHHKSALKRIRQSYKKKIYNRQNRKSLKLAMRAVREATTYEVAFDKLKVAGSLLDKLSCRGIMHKNTAAHRKSSLASYVNSLKATA